MVSRVAFLVVCSILGGLVLTDDQKGTCQPDDFHNVYTECDGEGGRWRVEVPKPDKDCVGGAPHPPVRGKDCQFTCEEGKYLDIDAEQDCKPCPAGSYSMGGGVRFDDWDHLPAGFSVKSEPFSPAISNVMRNYGMNIGKMDENCTVAGWHPNRKSITSLPSDCKATLQYTANLVKPGEVRFQYQYTDDNSIFHFSIQNSQCQSMEDKKSDSDWPEMTDEGEWRSITAQLKSGVNILYWKTIGVSSSKGTRPKPTKIKKIEISGIAFTQECTKCASGTHSANPGASQCEECPEDHYSERGALQCTPCDKVKEYAPKGSGKCVPRPSCKEDDYFNYNSPCDQDQKTQLMFHWIEPKICSETLPGAVSLPTSGDKKQCAPCNPGMELVGGSCQFCSENTFSNGIDACEMCPPSTAPEYSLEYKWWQNIPVEGNISASCLSLTDRGCVSETGWQMTEDHVESGKGHADDAYLVLGIQVGGFRGTEQVIHGKAASVGQISFVFETECKGKCSFYFMQQTENDGTAVIETWTGQQGKQKYSYHVTKTGEVTFSWAFQKAPSGESHDGAQYNFKEDSASIYAVNVTNTLQGGISRCKTCPKGASASGCIPCPQGQYIDGNTTRCMPCPAGFIVRGNSPWGIESCVRCGEGLTAKDGTKCVSTCSYKTADREYDFGALQPVTAVEGTRLFTSSGTQYFHLFNISLCAETQASCADNITARSMKKNTTVVITEDRTQATICRATILPPKPGEEGDTLSAQPVSLGDYLVKITNNGSALDIPDRLAREGFVKPTDDSDKFDLHLLYKSEAPTPACKQGRTTIITLRCDVAQDVSGTIQLPPKCPDGTCDGCDFHFLWKTQVACPVCKETEYQEVIGQCVAGEQQVHYLPPKHCVFLKDNSELVKIRKCSVLPFWLQVSILVAVGLGLLLLILVIYCWKKNKKLEYKYMKLVANTGKEGELPAAESCGLSDEEDDEENYDAVHFKKKGNLLHKFMGKQKDDMQMMLSEEEEI